MGEIEYALNLIVLIGDRNFIALSKVVDLYIF
jgi:hypothetical protein